MSFIPLVGSLDLGQGFMLYGQIPQGTSQAPITASYTLIILSYNAVIDGVSVNGVVEEVVWSPYFDGKFTTVTDTNAPGNFIMATFNTGSGGELEKHVITKVTPAWDTENNYNVNSSRVAVLTYSGGVLLTSDGKYLFHKNDTQKGTYVVSDASKASKFTFSNSGFFITPTQAFAGYPTDVRIDGVSAFSNFSIDLRGGTGSSGDTRPGYCNGNNGYWCDQREWSNSGYYYLTGVKTDDDYKSALSYNPNVTVSFVPLNTNTSNASIGSGSNGSATSNGVCGNLFFTNSLIPLYWFTNGMTQFTNTTGGSVQLAAPSENNFVVETNQYIYPMSWTTQAECTNNFYYSYCSGNSTCGSCFGQCPATSAGTTCNFNTLYTDPPPGSVEPLTCIVPGPAPPAPTLKETFWEHYKWWVIGIIVAVVVIILIMTITIVVKSKKSGRS